MKDKLVYISAHLPSPQATQAGQKNAYSRLKWLMDKYRVQLICFVNEAEKGTYFEENYSQCDSIRLIPVTNVMRVAGIIKNLRQPLIVSARYSAELKKHLSDLYNSPENIIFWYEYDQMCQYIPNKKYSGKTNIGVCHDILWQMFDRREKKGGLPGKLFGIEKTLVYQWEKTVLSLCDAVLVPEEKDKLLLEDLYDLQMVHASYPEINPYPQVAEDMQDGILFFGAMNRGENEEAVLWFLDNIWETLSGYYKDLKFYIVGASPSNKLKKICEKKDNIVLTGFVDNPAVYFAKALFSVAPIQIGAGVKIKVLECMQYGLPVVATEVGAEGINATAADGLFVTDEVNEYLKICGDLLADTKKCKLLQECSREWFMKKYKPYQETADRIYKIIEGIKDLRK